MTAAIHDVDAAIRRIVALTPADSQPSEYARSLLEAELESSAKPFPMGIVAGRSSNAALASALISAERLSRPESVASRPEGIVDLGVIEWLLRPALPLTSGLFLRPVSGPWHSLRGDEVSSFSAAVCRLDAAISGGPSAQIGTGAVVGTRPNGQLAILTNAHVVEQVRFKFGWPTLPGITIVCRFQCESVLSSTSVYTAAPEFRQHDSFDAALIFLKAEDVQRMPIPIGSADPLGSDLSSPIGIVGHPSFDSRFDPFPKTFGFGEEFGILRFSPGFVRDVRVRPWRSGSVETILHDASTLSGSSGSPMIDLASGKLMGLHFGGWPRPRTDSVSNDADLFEANGAVPIWRLTNSPMFSDIQFVDSWAF